MRVPTETVVAAISRCLDGRRHVAVGTAAPLHAAAALLAKERRPDTLRVTVLGSRDEYVFDGGQELFDCAAQGRMDAFMFGGGQIDGAANINFIGRGPHPDLTVRWPGSFGSPFLYAVVPHVVLVAEEHSLRRLPVRVDHISAAGPRGDDLHRLGGPDHLVTELCVFRFSGAGSGFVLETMHPDVSLDEIRARTGFVFGIESPVATTAEVTNEERALLRGPVAEALAPTYPSFAEELCAR